MHLAELNILQLRALIDSAQLRDFVATIDRVTMMFKVGNITGNCRTSSASSQANAPRLAKKMGMKAHSAVLTFLPLLVLALKRAPGADGGQSPQKEVYS